MSHPTLGEAKTKNSNKAHIKTPMSLKKPNVICAIYLISNCFQMKSCQEKQMGFRFLPVKRMVQSGNQCYVLQELGMLQVQWCLRFYALRYLYSFWPVSGSQTWHNCLNISSMLMQIEPVEMIDCSVVICVALSCYSPGLSQNPINNYIYSFSVKTRATLYTVSLQQPHTEN